jgi:hypothetical protein
VDEAVGHRVLLRRPSRGRAENRLGDGQPPGGDLVRPQRPGRGLEDQAVHRDLERAAAKRLGATIYDIDSSHVPMLSHPDYVLDVIRTAARGI